MPRGLDCRKRNDADGRKLDQKHRAAHDRIQAETKLRAKDFKMRGLRI